MAIQERRERERAHRHELIVRTARELAEAEGWDAVTTRRLAERIEYSQPVLYSHFSGKEAIVAAVAVQGFAELAAELARSRAGAATPAEAVDAISRAYVRFAEGNPALYDAMFVLATGLHFARPEAPEALKAGFGQIRDTLVPVAGARDPGLFTELCWSALHGLITLARDGRIPADQQEQRLTMLVELILSGAS